MNAMRGLSLSLTRTLVAAVSALVAFGAACGGEQPLVGTFTSDVVQRNVCRISGNDARETCVRDSATSTYRVFLVEDENDRVWISGIPVDGESDRRVLGTRDIHGGFLFEHVTSSLNQSTRCRLTTSLSLSVAVDENANPADIGSDPCIALVGREVRTRTTSAECDDINETPVAISRITRRRWEPSPTCGAEE